MKAQAVVQQVVVHQHRGAQKPHGAHHGRRVQRCLRHADGAREGVTIGHFKPPVCCAVVIKAISLQKEYKHIIYTLRSMFIIFWLLVAFIICFSKKEIRNSQSNMQTSSISPQNRTRIQSLQIRRDGTCVKKYFSLLAQGYTWASTSIQGFG